MQAKVKHRGAWPGNDTIWRMVVDLYQGMLEKERKYFSVIDGIIAGEGQGPFCPTSKNANTLIVGDNLLAADIAAVRYMGFDPQKIKYLDYFINQGIVDYQNIQIHLNGEIQKDFFTIDSKYKDFFVVEQWQGIKK